MRASRLTGGGHLAATGPEGGANLLVGAVGVSGVVVVVVVVGRVAAVGVSAGVGLGGLLAGELL